METGNENVGRRLQSIVYILASVPVFAHEVKVSVDPDAGT